MAARQRPWFLLADTPSPARRAWAGLFIKVLIARGNLQRCLVICPGSLAKQRRRRLSLPSES